MQIMGIAKLEPMHTHICQVGMRPPTWGIMAELFVMAQVCSTVLSMLSGLETRSLGLNTLIGTT